MIARRGTVQRARIDVLRFLSKTIVFGDAAHNMEAIALLLRKLHQRGPPMRTKTTLPKLQTSKQSMAVILGDLIASLAGLDEHPAEKLILEAQAAWVRDREAGASYTKGCTFYEWLICRVKDDAEVIANNLSLAIDDLCAKAAESSTRSPI
jgi:hypothetical protein